MADQEMTEESHVTTSAPVEPRLPSIRRADVQAARDAMLAWIDERWTSQDPGTENWAMLDLCVRILADHDDDDVAMIYLRALARGMRVDLPPEASGSE